MIGTGGDPFPPNKPEALIIAGVGVDDPLAQPETSSRLEERVGVVDVEVESVGEG